MAKKHEKVLTDADLAEMEKVFRQESKFTPVGDYGQMLIREVRVLRELARQTLAMAFLVITSRSNATGKRQKAAYDHFAALMKKRQERGHAKAKHGVRP